MKLSRVEQRVVTCANAAELDNWLTTTGTKDGWRVRQIINTIQYPPQWGYVLPYSYLTVLVEREFNPGG